MTDAPTAQFQESFELVRLLGVGGFAQTHLARVCDDDLIEEFGTNEVALKIPLNKKHERVLRRELEMNVNLHVRLKHLDSKNLVRYLGFAVFRGQIVMAMEYVRQGSLRNTLGKVGAQRRIPVNDAISIATQLLDGLDVIHQERILHRDIKPENILMNEGTPKIADLGISRMLETNELAETRAGTLYYMAPEILLEDGGSFQVDVWSVGVTLYEMTTGRLPFGEPNTPILRLCELITKSEIIPPSQICADLPPALDMVIARALKKNPSERFSSAAEMRDALKPVAETDDQKIDREIAGMSEIMRDPSRGLAVERTLQNLAARYPRSAKAFQYLGEYYNRCHKYEEAIRAFQAGLAVSPKSALLHWDLALAYQNLQRRSEAATSLERAISLGLDPSLQRHAATLLNALRRSHP